nr:hypothetical protein [Gammaproteobacteria bacterium]
MSFPIEVIHIVKTEGTCAPDAVRDSASNEHFGYFRKQLHTCFRECYPCGGEKGRTCGRHQHEHFWKAKQTLLALVRPQGSRLATWLGDGGRANAGSIGGGGGWHHTRLRMRFICAAGPPQEIGSGIEAFWRGCL